MKDIAIKENHLYQKAYRNGEKAHSKHISVYILRDWGAKKQMLKNPEKQYINRVGLSVSKKIGGAVVRSRVKRIIRAGLSQAREYGQLKTGYLIVIAARVGAHEVKSTEIGEELIRAFQRLDMYKTPKAPKTEEGGK
ncbi:MAG: ribonuclease P protein component [Clostridia bacterium]|nr:ribonuclease P protein component [Clostridia bacterium]